MSDETITFETRWVGGRGAQDRSAAVARAFEESAHTLNYATMYGAGGAEAPSQIYSLLASLYTGTGYLPQGLRQLAARLAAMQEAGSLEMREGDPEEALVRFDGAMFDAAQAAEQLTAALQRGQNAISALGMTQQAGAAVGRAFGNPEDDYDTDENEEF